MNQKTIKADFMLLLAAVIWGFAFVAQRAGMEFIGPFTFNAIRFFIGGLSLIPLILIQKTKAKKNDKKVSKKKFWVGSIFAGSFLFIASSLQQVGIISTTAGNAGFITGLYVIIVPILGIFLRRKTSNYTWIGGTLAVIGMYFLSVKKGITISNGDMIVLIGAFFWAIHVLTIDKLISSFDSLRLAYAQFMICSLLSLLFTLIFEQVDYNQIIKAILPILYAGIMSVGVAFTLQVVAQRNTHPSHAVILLSFEAVFAVIGGVIILDESLSVRGIIGCCLMFFGMLLSQLQRLTKKPKYTRIEL